MPEFTREQIAKFNKIGYTSVSARMVACAEAYLKESEGKRDACRHYLMSTPEKDISVSEALTLLGFGPDGIDYE